MISAADASSSLSGVFGQNLPAVGEEGIVFSIDANFIKTHLHGDDHSLIIKEFLGSNIKYLSLKGCWCLPSDICQTLLAICPKVIGIDMRCCTTSDRLPFRFNGQGVFPSLLSELFQGRGSEIRTVLADDCVIEDNGETVLTRWQKTAKATFDHGGFYHPITANARMLTHLQELPTNACGHMSSIFGSVRWIDNSLFVNIASTSTFQALSVLSLRLSSEQLIDLFSFSLPNLRSFSLPNCRELNYRCIVRMPIWPSFANLQTLALGWFPELKANRWETLASSDNFPKGLTVLQLTDCEYLPPCRALGAINAECRESLQWIDMSRQGESSPPSMIFEMRSLPPFPNLRVLRLFGQNLMDIPWVKWELPKLENQEELLAGIDTNLVDNSF